MQEFEMIQNSKTKETIKITSKNLLAIDDNFYETRCEICDSLNNEDKMLLCDSCDCGYHTFCLGIARIPNLNTWYCQFCIKNQVKKIQELQKIEINDAKHFFKPTSFLRSCRKDKPIIRLRRSSRINKAEKRCI